MTSGIGRFIGTRTLAAAMALAAICGTATAQLAPPPGGAPEPEPAINPPVPPAMRAQQERGNVVPPTGEQARPRSAEEMIRAGLSPEEQAQLKLPYDSLVKRDDAGQIIQLEENAHIAAMRVNPLMDDSTMERAQGVIAERRARIEDKVIENMDLIQRVLDGAIDSTPINDPSGLGVLLGLVKPFQEMSNLTEDLKTQGVLTDVQYVFNWNIVNEYQQAMLAQAGNTPGDDHPAIYMTRHVVNDAMREPLAAYDSLLLEAASSLDVALAGLDLADDKAAAVQQARGAVESAGDDEAKVAAMRTLAGHLDAAQKAQMLRTVVENR